MSNQVNDENVKKTQKERQQTNKQTSFLTL